MGKDLTNGTKAATLRRQNCNELLKRAQIGDNAALPELQRLLNESPDLWNDLGNIAVQAWHSWADLAAGHNAVIKEALLRQMESLMLELSGPSPTNLERLLITRVVLCWRRHLCRRGGADALRRSVVYGLWPRLHSGDRRCLRPHLCATATGSKVYIRRMTARIVNGTRSGCSHGYSPKAADRFVEGIGLEEPW